MWAVRRPQQGHGSHQHWGRGQGDVGEWGRGPVSSPFFSLCRCPPPPSPPPPWCYSESAQWLTPGSCQSEHCYCLCAQQRGGRGPEVLWSRPKPCSPTPSLFLFSYFSFVPSPSHFLFLSFIACVRIQAKGEACVKHHLISMNLFCETPKQSNPVEATNKLADMEDGAVSLIIA